MISALAATPRLQHLSEADLDALIAELRGQGTKELVLLGLGVELTPIGPLAAAPWPLDAATAQDVEEAFAVAMSHSGCGR